MHSDRYTKVVLTIIAIGLWALTITQLQVPEAQARPQAGAGSGSGPAVGLRGQDTDELLALEQFSQGRQEPLDAAGPRPHAPASTKPLRWRIPWARHLNQTGAGTVDCVTGVQVVNFAPRTINVDVEFLNFVGGSQGMITRSMPAGVPQFLVTDDDTDETPLNIDGFASTGNFDGYAHVNADDPRIFVTAVVRCGEDGKQLPVSITTVPAYPVGTTAEYFQAWIPGSDVPQVRAGATAEARD
jgi:hypothetical protein